MSWTIDKALDDESIDRTEKTPSGYSFWLKAIPDEIRVSLLVNPVRGGFNFHLSHYIHTPNQDDAYRPSRPWGDDKAYALHLAVTAITQYYRNAVKDGHKPNSTWLVKNQNDI